MTTPRLPLYLVCEAARQHVTVALTGDGGDESFAGYERYVAHELAGRLHVPGVGTAARALRSMGKERRSTAVARSPPAGGCRLATRRALRKLMEVFSAEARVDLLDADFVPRPSPAWQRSAPRRPAIAGLQLLDVQTYLPGDLLLKADIASMAHSLELRSPFLDWEVLQLGVSLPAELKTKGRRGKEALRRAFAADFPRDRRTPQVRLRRAARQLFRNELRDVAGDVLLDARARTAASFGRVRWSGCSATTSKAAPTTRTDCGACSCSSSGSGRISTRDRRQAYVLVAAVTVVPRLGVLLHERDDILESFTEKSDEFARTFVDHGTFGFLPGEPRPGRSPSTRSS